MKLTWIRPLLFLTLIMITLHCGGATTDAVTDPVDIPTPVSHLSISSPGSDGNVRITAPDGYADPGTTVTIETSSASSSESENELLSASVSARLTTASDTVADDGSFQLELEGSIDDTCTITYTTDGTETTGTGTVPANQPPLPLSLTLTDIDIDPVENFAMVLANDGIDGFIYVIDLSDGSLDYEIELTGASGADHLSVDRRTGGFAAIDSDSDAVYDIHADYTNYDEVSVTDGNDIVAGKGGNFYMIAQTGDTNFSYYSVAMNLATAYTGLTADGTTFVAGILADSGFDTNDVFAMVAEMSNGAYYLFTFTVADSSSITQTAAIELVDVNLPTGLALFSDGSEALITDSANDSVLRVDVSTGDITTISVGDAPLGIALYPDDSVAYVVASGDDEIEVIDLSSNALSDSESAGIEPSAVSFGSTSNPLIPVMNTGDNTVLLFEPE